MGFLLTEQQAIIKAGVNGVSLPKVYSWTSLAGGDVVAEMVQTLPGGMKPQIVLGGPAKRTDITVKRPHSSDLQPFMLQLENSAGQASAWVSYTLLDANGNPQASTTTITGILKQAKRPDFDANANAVAYLELVITPNAEASKS